LRNRVTHILLYVYERLNETIMKVRWSLGILICSFIACTSPDNKQSAVAGTGKDPVPLKMNDMRSYLEHQAAVISDHSREASAEELERLRPQHYQEFLEMMGIDGYMEKSRHTDLNVKVTGSVQKDGYRIEKLYFESLPKLYVRCNLYLPDNITDRRPTILYVSGHAPDQKSRYQTHPEKLAKLGFVCMLMETIQWAEVKGEHWGPSRNGMFNWYSRGYNPGGVELWNAIRAIDVLSLRKEVDSTRIGVTGISGGGSQSWYIAAADPRIKAAVPVCGAGTLKDHVLNRTVDGHCDCMMPNNIYFRDFRDIGELIAPRPLMIAQSDQDGMYRIEAVRELAQQVEKTYDLFGKPSNVSFVETPGEHSYHQISRENSFAFFMEHLMNKKMTPNEVGDIDTIASHLATPEELRIHVNGLPKDDRTPTIQNTFNPVAGTPSIHSPQQLDSLKAGVKKYLTEKTFRAFPASPVEFDPRVEMTSMDSKNSGNAIYSINTEEGWRLKVDVHWNHDPKLKRPLTIVLRNYDEERWGGESFASQMDTSSNVAFFEVRGVGETGWDPSLQWHLRRAAAWTGRTIASMQVYDLMRCLEFCRTLENVNANDIRIAAQRELGAVALYAALMDGRCSQVILKDPPATQDAGGPVEGKDAPMEMLNCLRVTDVNQLPALIVPTKTTFMGNVPSSYAWARSIINQPKIK
jgi:cephalosporin-C deacetylase-like acetyl esterase